MNEQEAIKREQLLRRLVGNATQPARGAAAASIGRVDRSRPLRLSFSQQRLWFLDQIRGAQNAYRIPLVWNMRGPLRPDLLRQALDAMVARHEVLRTTFTEIDGEPVQVIHAHALFELEEIDVRAEVSKASERERIVSDRVRRPFDFVRGPLIRGSPAA